MSIMRLHVRGRRAIPWLTLAILLVFGVALLWCGRVWWHARKASLHLSSPAQLTHVSLSLPTLPKPSNAAKRFFAEMRFVHESPAWWDGLLALRRGTWPRMPSSLRVALKRTKEDERAFEAMLTSPGCVPRLHGAERVRRWAWNLQQGSRALALRVVLWTQADWPERAAHKSTAAFRRLTDWGSRCQLPIFESLALRRAMLWLSYAFSFVLRHPRLSPLARTQLLLAFGRWQGQRHSLREAWSAERQALAHMLHPNQVGHTYGEGATWLVYRHKATASLFDRLLRLHLLESRLTPMFMDQYKLFQRLKKQWQHDLEAAQLTRHRWITSNAIGLRLLEGWRTQRWTLWQQRTLVFGCALAWQRTRLLAHVFAQNKKEFPVVFWPPLLRPKQTIGEPPFSPPMPHVLSRSPEESKTSHPALRGEWFRARCRMNQQLSWHRSLAQQRWPSWPPSRPARVHFGAQPQAIRGRVGMDVSKTTLSNTTAGVKQAPTAAKPWSSLGWPWRRICRTQAKRRICRFFDAWGRLRLRAHFEETRREGATVLYYPDGARWARWTFRADKRYGKVVWWYHLGPKMREVPYLWKGKGAWVKVVREGTERWWHRNRQLAYRVSWYFSKRWGWSTAWFANGRKQYEGGWKKDRPLGVWWMWNQNWSWSQKVEVAKKLK